MTDTHRRAAGRSPHPLAVFLLALVAVTAVAVAGISALHHSVRDDQLCLSFGPGPVNNGKAVHTRMVGNQGRTAVPSMVQSAAPTIRPAWPRTSSAASGFFFCGMIELPVLSASGSATKPNGWLAQTMNSSARRERCSEHCAAAWR